MKRSVPGIQGRTDFRLRKYVGPCQTSGTHLFSLRLFAFSRMLKLDARSGKQALEKAIAPYILSFGFIKGIYGCNLRVSK